MGFEPRFQVTIKVEGGNGKGILGLETSIQEVGQVERGGGMGELGGWESEVGLTANHIPVL